MDVLYFLVSIIQIQQLSLSYFYKFILMHTRIFTHTTFTLSYNTIHIIHSVEIYKIHLSRKLLEVLNHGVETLDLGGQSLKSLGVRLLDVGSHLGLVVLNGHLLLERSLGLLALLDLGVGLLDLGVEVNETLDKDVDRALRADDRNNTSVRCRVGRRNGLHLVGGLDQRQNRLGLLTNGLGHGVGALDNDLGVLENAVLGQQRSSGLDNIQNQIVALLGLGVIKGRVELGVGGSHDGLSLVADSSGSRCHNSSVR